MVSESMTSGEFVLNGLMEMLLRSRLQTTIRRRNMAEEKLHPVHPGEVLSEEFLKPMGLSQNRVAQDIGVPPRRINEIVLEKRRITADTALRLSKYFGTSPQFWLGLQTDYDLDIALDSLGSRLEREVKTHSTVC